MYKELELCQKALTEYLDMKKNIFPRFYFVSNMALLVLTRRLALSIGRS